MTLNFKFISKKLSPGGADVGKLKKIIKKPWYLHYLTTFIDGTGIKIGGTLQGSWGSCPFALKFDYIKIKYKKPHKIQPFLLILWLLFRFFNSSQILAQKTTKFIFLTVYRFIWHPSNIWIWLNSAWKELGTILAVCFYSKIIISDFGLSHKKW